MSLSVYDFWILLRGEVRSLAVVFVVCVVLPDSPSDPLATGLSLRRRAMIQMNRCGIMYNVGGFDVSIGSRI
jgi:hypothetical protein